MPKALTAQRVVAEEVMGRPLPKGAQVLFANGDKSDMRHENLVVCQDHAYLCLLIQRRNALRASGHADWRRCTYCKGYSPEGVVKSYAHPECSNAAHRRRVDARHAAEGTTRRYRLDYPVPWFGPDRVNALFAASEGEPDECWPWAGEISVQGYGRIIVARRRMPAHRHAYERSVGPVPGDYHVHHLCGTKRCVNPAHLELLSPVEHAAVHEVERNRARNLVRGIGVVLEPRK